MKKLLTYLWRGTLGVASAIISVLSLPPVRNFVWNRLMKKGQQKVVDAKAKVVEGENKDVLS